MGLFSNKEVEQLTTKLGTVQAQLTSTERLLANEKTFNNQLTEQVQTQSKQLKYLNEKLREASPAAPASTRLSRFMQWFGLFFIAVSLALAYILATKEISSFNLSVLWTIYIVTQLFGLYLVGYGKEKNFGSFQRFGAYMSVLFLITCCLMMLSLIGLIQLRIGLNLVFLGLINSLGVIVLIYAEREVLRLHKPSL